MKVRSICLAVLSLWAVDAYATVITLETAQNFAVLGGTGVTVAGAATTTISGNVGDYPYYLASITGFPPGVVVNGSTYAADNNPGNIASQAQADENTTYGILAALPSTENLAGDVLGSGGTPGFSTLFPGVYAFPSTSAQVDGALTLNFEGLSNVEFVFQIGSTLTTASDASIVVENGNSTDAIYWQVGSSATLGSGTTFAGNILASTSITLGTTASIECGRALADTGSVTLDGGNFISDNCSIDNTASGFPIGNDFGSYGFSGGAATPEPGTFLLLGTGILLSLIVYARLSRKRTT